MTDAPEVQEAERLPDDGLMSMAHTETAVDNTVMGGLLASPTGGLGMDGTMSFMNPGMDVMAPAGSTQATLQQLQATVNQFMSTMNNRMLQLEQSVFYVQKAVEEQAPLARELRNVIQYMQQNAAAMSAGTMAGASAAPAIENESAPFSLKFRTLTTKWYTERLFPTFYVDVIDETTGELYRKTPNWKAVLRLKDGNGNFIDDRIGDLQTRTITFVEGTAEVTGLKFTVVSSKRGNFFNLETSITQPTLVSGNVRAAKSENLVVLSCRLFHNPKRPLTELSSDDALSKMPGIGRLYAERFAASGVSSIRQLSLIPLGVEGKPQRTALLQLLRRDKGTMTESRMVEYIEQALDIVRKTDATEQLRSLSDLADLSQSAPKRQRTTSGAAAAAASIAGAAELNDPNKLLDVDDFINYSTEDSPPKKADTSTASPFDLAVAAPDQSGIAWNQLAGDDVHRNIQHPTTTATTGMMPAGATSSTGLAPMPQSMSSSSSSIATASSHAAQALFSTVTSTTGSTSSHPRVEEPADPAPARGAAIAPVSKGGVRASIQYPLHNAIGTDNVVLLRNVIAAMREGNLPLDEENQCGWTPLMLAAAKGNSKAVGLLCELQETNAGHQSSVTGMSALHLASMAGHDAVVQMLLRQNGVDAGCLNKQLHTPLMLAARQGNVDVVRILAKIADSYRPKTQEGNSLYHLAALSGAVEMLQLVHDGLLNYGLVMTTASDRSEKYGKLVWDERQDRESVPSIMHCAAFRGSADAIQWLLDHGVDPAVVDERGLSPLHMAAYGGHAEVCSLLCLVLDVNATSMDGLSPLHYAGMNGTTRSAGTVKALIEAGATDNNDLPAAFAAVSTNNLGALMEMKKLMGCPRTKQGDTNLTCEDMSKFFENDKALLKLCGELMPGELAASGSSGLATTQ